MRDRRPHRALSMRGGNIAAHTIEMRRAESKNVSILLVFQKNNQTEDVHAALHTTISSSGKVKLLNVTVTADRAANLNRPRLQKELGRR